MFDPNLILNVSFFKTDGVEVIFVSEKYSKV
jgi:hypothetical protein